MRLNTHDTFGLPLGPKTLAFLRIAYGAGALAVEAVKGVPVLAELLLRVDVANGIRVALAVLGRGQGVQVLRVNAAAVATNVVDHMPLWNLAARKDQREPVSLSIRAPERNDAVAVLVLLRLPLMAIADTFPFRVEARDLFGCWGNDQFKPFQTVVMADTAHSVGVLR